MKKLLLAAAVAAAVSSVSPVIADTLKITHGNNQTIQVNLSGFSYNTSTGVLQVTTNETIGNDEPTDPGNGGTDPDPDPDPDPEPEPEPGNCEDAPSNVTCTAPLDWTRGESNSRISIPRNKIVASPFVTTSSENGAGMVSFENVAPLVGVDIWISTSPGGNALPQTMCKIDNKSLAYSLRWSQYESRRTCSLEPGTQYYFNIKHSVNGTNSSVTTRTRTFTGL